MRFAGDLRVVLVAAAARADREERLIAVQDLRAAIRGAGRHGGGPPRRAMIPFTPAARRVLDEAGERAAGRDVAELTAEDVAVVLDHTPDEPNLAGRETSVARRSRGEAVRAFSAAEASEFCDVPESALVSWEAAGRLVGSEMGGVTYYAAYQFDSLSRQPASVMAEVIAAFRAAGASDWGIESWMVAQAPDMGHRRPADIVEDDPDAIRAELARVRAQPPGSSGGRP